MGNQRELANHFLNVSKSNHQKMCSRIDVQILRRAYALLQW